MKFLWCFLLGIFAGALSDAVAVTDSRDASTGEWEVFGGLPYGCDGIIQAIAVADSGLVYLGGDFQSCENVPASYLVAYDPDTQIFSALLGVNGQGLDGPVRALTVSGSDLYAGGEFEMADGLPVGKIARFDGSAWHSLGSGISDPYLDDYWVNAIAVSDDAVYAAGRFHSAGGVEVNKIARFEGGIWHAPGSGIGAIADYSEVFALQMTGDGLLVGGSFVFAGGVESACIARWDGEAWHPFGQSLISPGESCEVYALAVQDDNLFAGGDFRLDGSDTRNNVARWDGGQWNVMGPPTTPGVVGSVHALAVLDDSLYAGGYFQEAGGVNASAIARWDGVVWQALGQEEAEGLNAPVLELVSANGLLYVGGLFSSADNLTVHRVVSWDGDEWLPVGQENSWGINGSVSAVAQIGTDLYAAGRFQSAGGVAVNNIARWDGRQWNALGAGDNNGIHGIVFDLIIIQPHVMALAAINGDLYVAGTFRYAGDLEANHIARWDGDAWHALDSGVGRPSFPAQVWTLAASGGELYVGGNFSEVSGIKAQNIAHWDGAAWHPIDPDGLPGIVRAIVVHEGDLYATGGFSSAGNLLVNSIARWDGTVWHALGQGLERAGSSMAYGYAMTMFGGNLYVGGNFDRAGGLEVGRIARWDGNSWHALGTGFMSKSGVDYVLAIAASGNHLFAGGGVNLAGGNVVGGMAMWNGSEWRRLGSDGEHGTDGHVNALLARPRSDCFGMPGAEVFVGGRFSRAGGKVSQSIALYSSPSEPNPEHIFCSRFK